MVAEKEKIDFVVAWVDGSDKSWLKEKNNYNTNESDGKRINAYRDWDLLKYWFRGVETNAPWVNKIYFITWGHLPSWLNVNHPKLVIVNHTDYIPKKYLPTFSSHPIELNMHRISGLSECFSYFNDDMYIIDKMTPEDFFKNGVPCDKAVLNVNCEKLSWQIQKINNNNIGVINEEFDFKKSFRTNRKKWFSFHYGLDLFRTIWLLPCPRFPGIKHEHANGNYLKSTFNEVWDKYYDVLDSTCQNKFRNPDSDVNQWLMKDWQIANGNFVPQKTNSIFCDLKFKEQFNVFLSYIKNKKSKIICINDAENLDDKEFELKKEKLIEAFDSILPRKSEFEL